MAQHARGSARRPRSPAREGRLIDFWTYSCINCRRSLPHIQAWDRAYRDKGPTVIGVHSPEFAFEKSADNVADQARKLGATYPVALDNDLDTWDNYRNRFGPPSTSSTPRAPCYFSFGEGRYAQTENIIRNLLNGAPTLYRLTDDATARQARLELRLTAGLQAFAFTFG
ncbi:redoxin domain-containing protein [Streptomyces sp. H27-H5]|uniref:redoxin domain-containing protein n=1 Tax=Streptomyces sp. H27-H5 TaxID=2996460 RepID=UPI00227217B2|nr:redoxin domain-containing protein [Streptomyces sp. H27-H5]MCY0960257.1 redoxin domain-containing protein [Streptomyces sp. H27-H5]